ncbi:nucleotide exchange factor GrpE [Candidatus Parcubacteria bacterium]|nr:nucleotide exchange factor GrpE [Candidatus Parcubacteria bacterium]
MEQKNTQNEIENLKKEIEKLKKSLQETEKLKNEYLRGWQRARADLINYKQEERERIEEVAKRANENFILEFLPILDNFEIAEKSLPKEKKEDQIVKGFLQIKQQILEFLKKYGLKEIESVGKKFDPLLHEVIGEVDTDEVETGVIVEEIQKGYEINGKVLRPAKVKVAK